VRPNRANSLVANENAPPPQRAPPPPPPPPGSRSPLSPRSPAQPTAAAGGKRETRGATEAAMLHTTMLEALDEMQSSRCGRALQELGAEMSSEQMMQMLHGFLGAEGRAETLAVLLPEASRAALCVALAEAAPEEQLEEEELGDEGGEERGVSSPAAYDSTRAWPMTMMGYDGL